MNDRTESGVVAETDAGAALKLNAGAGAGAGADTGGDAGCSGATGAGFVFGVCGISICVRLRPLGALMA